jgi:hypothetical protein
MLVRVDVLAPAAEGTARFGEDVALVLDGRGSDVAALAAAALEQLGARDRIAVVDSSGPRMVVPPMPASQRSLVLAAIERALGSSKAAAPDRPSAIALARGALAGGTTRRVLVLGDEGEASDGPEASGASPGAADAPPPAAGTIDLGDGQEVAFINPMSGDLEARLRAVRDFVPPCGATEFRDVVLSFEGIPAPSHVLEASGGDARWELEGGELGLGDVRAGEERAEVVRVTIPAWTPGEAFSLHVTARFSDLSQGGETRTMGADLHSTYDDNVERLAESRHGDVIAYASALATLSRLDAAFVGGRSLGSGGLRSVAQMHARSLALLARDMHDPAAAEQAALLEALLSAVP